MLGRIIRLILGLFTRTPCPYGNLGCNHTRPCAQCYEDRQW